MKSELGKIERANFIITSEGLIGLQLTLTGRNWGSVDTSYATLDLNKHPVRDGIGDDTQTRLSKYALVLKNISDLLHKAKVHSVKDLEGTPVEIMFENKTLKNWRVLEEVL